MAAEPTPEEREKADKELQAREAEEQSQLPYQWNQTIKDVDVTITIDGKYKGRDLDVKFTKTTLKVAIKGQEPFIDVSQVTTQANFPVPIQTAMHDQYSRPS
jgi:HSP20 family molecular chaperone IbpA